MAKTENPYIHFYENHPPPIDVTGKVPASCKLILPFATAHRIPYEHAEILHQFYSVEEAFFINYYEIEAIIAFEAPVKVKFSIPSLIFMIQGSIQYKDKHRNIIREPIVNHHHLTHTRKDDYLIAFEKTELSRLMTISFDIVWLRRMIRDLTTINPMLTKFLEGNEPNPAMMSILIDDINEYLQKLHFKGSYSFGEIQGKLIQIVSTFLKRYNHQLNKQDQEQNLEESKIHIDTNFHDPLVTHKTIKVKFHRITNFVNNFKAKYGRTPEQYLLYNRIEKAKELLLMKPFLKINEVSSKVGYEDPKSFSKYFKKVVGLSPSQFRKNNTKT